MVVAYFDVLCVSLPEVTEIDHENSSLLLFALTFIFIPVSLV